MFGFLKKLLGDPTADWPHSVPDPILGEWRLSEDADWWEAAVALGDRTVEFHIDSAERPDEATVAHVHQIIQEFVAFEARVTECLERELDRLSYLRPFADEVRQLRIDDVTLSGPGEGMIYFKGPDPHRLWRCDYCHGEPRGLGFDS
jgi:hypothetical protein